MQGTRSETYLHGAHDNKLHQVDILDNGTPDTRILGRDARGALTLDTHLFSSLGWSGVDMGYTRFGDLANPPIYEALEVTEQKNHEAQRIRDSRWVTWDMENDGRYLTTQDQLYDLDGQLLEQHEVLPTSLLRQFVYLDGQPLAMITGYGDIHYFHNDHLGTPQVLTNGSGAVTWKARYDAFGKATLLVNAVEQPLRFPGQVVDRHVPELHYNWHRYYDTTTGRYVSSDPIGLEGGWNTYGYARQSPGRFTDPEGLSPAGPAAAAVGAIAACMRIPACRLAVREAIEACEDVRCKVSRHTAHHRFGGRGFCEHIQIVCWVKGGKQLFRAQFALPGRCSPQRSPGDWLRDKSGDIPFDEMPFGE